jgi:VWFA-related protein
MRGRGGSRALAGLALCMFSAAAVAFQSPETPADQTPRLIPRTHDQREQRFQALHRIILNVNVEDASGKPYPNLKQTDFTLYDNDQPRSLVAFLPKDGDSAKDPPHVILVLDAVNNSSRQLRSFVRDIESFLKEGDGRLDSPVSVGVFSGADIEVGPASRDRSAVLADLETRAGDLHATGCITEQDRSEEMHNRSVGGGAGGGYRAESSKMLMCLNQRFISSVMALRHFAQEQVEVPGRVILIWIGPGWPLLTNRSFTPDTPEIKKSFFAQLVELSTVLREAQVTMDAVASPEDLPDAHAPSDPSFFGGVTNEDQAKAGNLGLHALAFQTGGRIVTDGRDLPRQIGACIADAESYYVLTFDAPPAGGFGEYHALAVKVDKPGLEVHTNTVYYAEQ